MNIPKLTGLLVGIMIVMVHVAVVGSDKLATKESLRALHKHGTALRGTESEKQVLNQAFIGLPAAPGGPSEQQPIISVVPPRSCFDSLLICIGCKKSPTIQ